MEEKKSFSKNQCFEQKKEKKDKISNTNSINVN